MRLDNKHYLEDLDTCATSSDWSVLDGATVAISGATGMIGTFLVDELMRERREYGRNISVIAMGRNEQKARDRFPYFDEDGFTFERVDVSQYGGKPSKPADVVIHLASTTHPRAYATQPIGTISSNLTGLTNLLEYTAASGADAKFVFASSVEVYGENRGDVERFAEDYCGYLNCNTLRAGYPEAKRCGEALCQAYAKEKGVHVYIPRLPRTYGPTLLKSDSKALSQFIKKALAHEDIVLKSEGMQQYSYLYVADTVSGLLHVLTRGQEGEAYNVVDKRSDIQLKDLAGLLAQNAGVKVVFELPDAVERAGYSTATKAMLDGSKLQGIGWSARYGMQEGVQRTLNQLWQYGW